MAYKDPNSERSIVRTLIKKIYDGELNTDDIKNDNIELYITNKQLLDQAQSEYLNKTLKPVDWRINLIFTGEGGTGKTTLANLIARELNKTIFTFTDIDAGFMDYINEDVVIWDEMRSYLIKEWGIGRFLSTTNNGIFNDVKINVKYGSRKIAQNFNFLTTSEDARNFLTGLTDRTYTDWTHKELTEPENPDQITRRFRYFFTFSKKPITQEEYKTTINLYKYNPLKDDNGTYSFYDKYEIIKTWNFNATEESYYSELKKIAIQIAKAIHNKKLNDNEL